MQRDKRNWRKKEDEGKKKKEKKVRKILVLSYYLIIQAVGQLINWTIEIYAS